MRYTYLLLAVLFFSCDNGAFDRDKRQIMAKDALRSSLPAHSKNFDVISFDEDTLNSWQEIKRPLQYHMEYTYTDSTGQQQQRQGTVLFTPNGRAILSTQNNNQ